MSKIVNPRNAAVLVARWAISPKSSKAIHSLTGQEVDQLPEQVAQIPIVRALVDRGILEDQEAEKPAPVRERQRAPEAPKPQMMAKKHKRP